MYEYDEECLQAFLEQQGKLFDEPVADTLEEAEAFLEDCMAAVVNNIEEVKEFLEEEGMDVDGMSMEEIERTVSDCRRIEESEIKIEKEE